MVRFALLVGASVFIALILLNTTQRVGDGSADVAFERDIVAAPTSTTAVASSTQSTDEVPAQTIVESSEAREMMSTPTHEIKERVKMLVAATSSSSSQRATEAIRSPALSPEALNEKARLALVNILCEASAPLRSTSGSGVFIDSRGIILTNAHIAQYFLLEDSPSLVSCTIRSGSPAVSKWRAKLIFIPDQWVEKHAKDILSSRATGTGEHDYAFLIITDSVDGTALPVSFPFTPLNYEEAARVTGDYVLVSGYPAEFIGGSAARSSLHASTVFSSVKQLLTFSEDMVDVISVGGTVLAQSGSSGGGFIDFAGSLVGLIVTTSSGDTTGARDLHAITPAHIGRSMRQHVGLSTQSLLLQESSALLSTFEPKAIELSKTLQAALESQRD